MNFCGQPGCEGHLGKFPDCLTEALWDISLDGGGESTGDSEFQGHVTLLIFDADDTWTLDADAAGGGGPTVPIPAGAYLVTTVESGAVWSEVFDSEAHARRAFDVKDRAYGRWLDQEDDERAAGGGRS